MIREREREILTSRSSLSIHQFLIDCCSGMAFLHGLSPPLVHRDLKSGNLLVSDKFVVKVVSRWGGGRESVRDICTFLCNNLLFWGFHYLNLNKIEKNDPIG